MLIELMPETPERQLRTQSFPYLMAASKVLGWEASWHALACVMTRRSATR